MIDEAVRQTAIVLLIVLGGVFVVGVIVGLLLAGQFGWRLP